MSSGDPGPLGYAFAGRGPAQRRLLAWLGERLAGCELDVAVAQRSPAGPWALKLHALAGDVSEVAALLQAEPWVERVVARPQHVYVRIGSERLCEWVAEGFALGAPDPLAGDEGRGRSVLVRAVDVGALAAAGEERPLRLFRETAVARGVAALLRSRGFEVTLELLPPGGETYDQIWAAAPGSVTHTVVVGTGVPMPAEVERGDHVVQLAVGEVDVRHGPLRARHGGSVSADDLVAEVGEAVLALLLIATPRARRIQLDERAVAREAATFGCLVEVLGAGAEAGAAALPVAGEGSPELARDLAAELDLAATNAARGATALDPALVARTLRSVADGCERLSGLSAGGFSSALRAAACAAVGGALGLAAIEAAPTAGRAGRPAVRSV